MIFNKRTGKEIDTTITQVVGRDMPRIGEEVEDTVTGVKGIAIYKNEGMSGTTQLAVQPKGNGDNLPEAWSIDWQTLKVIGFGQSRTAITPAKQTIELGDEVEDTVTGLKAIAVSRITYLNGCVSYGLQAKIGKDGKVPEYVYVDWKRLVVTKSAKVPLHEEAKKPETKRTGGPSMRVSSMRTI